MWFRILLLLAYLSTIFGCQTSSLGQPGCQIDSLFENTPPQFAIFYDDIVFNGELLSLTHPTGLRTINGQMSSLKVPDLMEVVLFEKEDFEGVYVVLSGNIPSLFDAFFNDRARSLFYRRKTKIVNPIVNMGGNMKILPIGLTVMEEELYIESILVPNGMEVVVITKFGSRLMTREYTFTSDTPRTDCFGQKVFSFEVKLI